MEVARSKTLHSLSDSWYLWAHLPHDTDWSLESYKKIYNFSFLEEAIQLTNYLPEKCIKNCMLFIMRNDIKPIWEDENNKNGGCFSYKILNKNVKDVWQTLTYALVGETLIEDKSINLKINGITISPKKNFCIIKIWVDNCNYQDASILNNKLNIKSDTCIFKKHLS